MDTGSLFNELYSRASATEPYTGMAATILYHSDRSAATVTGWDGRTLTVTEDTAVRTDKNGQSDAQTWVHERNPCGMRSYFKRRSDGTWGETWMRQSGKMHFVGRKGEGKGLVLGVRDHYYDFGF